MQLPKFPTVDRALSLLQTRWAQLINPVISLPMVNQNTLKNVSLKTGTNSVNHLLGRNLQGWFLIRQRASASIYDNQDNNIHPDISLTLVTSADVVVDLVVF